MTVYEVVLNGRIDDQPMLTVLHYDITGSTDFQAFANAISLIQIADMEDLLVPSATYTGITIREDVPGSVGITYPYTGGATGGQNATTDYWGIIALNVRKLTTTGVRPARGRVYQGGIPAVAVNDDGFMAGTYLADVNTYWNNMVTISFDGTGTAAMVIKATNPSAPNTVAYNPVSSMSTSARPSKQSRRNWLT